MKHTILTGTPGCGKTSIIQSLASQGIPVVTEAATDVITQKQNEGISTPWKNKTFIDDIVRLQQQRQHEQQTKAGDNPPLFL